MSPAPAPFAPDTILVWVGILACLSQSALFSGLNLAVFSVSRLRLEVEAAAGNPDALSMIELRARSNYVLTTILWGNVGINVLLALLSDSVMSGVFAFLFSTVVITLFGEIAPQAYFCRNALRVAGRLEPVLRFYMRLLYPVAKPSSLLLDAWLGPEGLSYYRERDLREVIRKHIEAEEAEIDRLEGIGALNFLAIDDLVISREGSRLAEGSLIALPFTVAGAEAGQAGPGDCRDRPVFPRFDRSADDPFLKRLHAARRRWVVLTDLDGEPRLVLDANGFLRAALFGEGDIDPADYLYRPQVIRDPHTLVGAALAALEAAPLKREPGRRGEDIILVWTDPPRLITGDDILRRLLRGIAVAPGTHDGTQAR